MKKEIEKFLPKDYFNHVWFVRVTGQDGEFYDAPIDKEVAKKWGYKPGDKTPFTNLIIEGKN
jgi:hypothetical protein